MATADSHVCRLSSRAWHRLEGIVETFERAWTAGARPDLDAYLTDDAANLRPALLFELAAADLEGRLRAGEPACAEDYFHRFPELRDDAALAVDLIAAECRQRGGAADGYVARFPEYGPALAARLTSAGTDDLDPGTTDAAPVAGFDGGVPAIAGYAILGELGRGGMGIVYRARQLALNRVVALKMIRAGGAADAGLRARFRAEAEAIARLQHPNIVQVHDVGTWPTADGGATPYLAMEYVASGSLADRLAGAPLPPGDAAALVETLARAVHAAHQAGILHRDLKPANVLLTPDGTPKVADFGLAKPLDAAAGQTQTGELVGTPSYVAPEQAAGRAGALGPAADVYALGAILYECLTGRPPFKAATPLETLDLVRSQEPVPPRALQPKVPRDLETVGLKCLAKEPARRYASAAALADDLGRFRAGQPVWARPAGLWEHGWKWAKRRPAVAAALAVSGLALAALVAVVVGFNVRLAAERDDADRHRRRAETSYTLARTALDRGITKVRDDPRLQRGDLEDVRRTMFQAEAGFYEQFVQLQGDDPAFQAERAEAYYRLGSITSALGSKKNAIQHYRVALDIDRRLAAADHDAPAPRYHLAQCLHQLGIELRATAQRDAARTAFREAEALLDALVQAHPNDADYPCDLADILLSRCLLDRDAGDAPSAEAGHRRAELLLAPLARAHPADARYQSRLARVYGDWASLCLRTKRPAQAEESYLKCLSLFEGLVRDHSGDGGFRRDLAATYTNLGLLYRGTNRLERSVQSSLRAEEQLDRLVREHPTVTTYQRDLADCRKKLGINYRLLERPGEAGEWLRKGIDTQERLLRDHPGVIQYAKDLGSSYFHLGVVLNGSGQPGAALAPLNRAVQLFEDPRQLDPQQDQARQALPLSLWERGLANKQLGQYAAARPDYDRAFTLSGATPAAWLCRQRAEVLARLGEHAAAFAEVERRSAGQKLDGETGVYLAELAALCCQAACADGTLPTPERDALAERYAARAVRWLADAKATGYFQNDDHRKKLQADPDLAPLRGRDDFRQLLP